MNVHVCVTSVQSRWPNVNNDFIRTFMDKHQTKFSESLANIGSHRSRRANCRYRLGLGLEKLNRNRYNVGKI